MQPHQSLRINLGDLKSQIVKKIGAERSNRYFYYLNRFLSNKLSKSEFDKLCHRVLGRENLPLHNLFIRATFKNACHAKIPPPIYKAGLPKSGIQAAESSPCKDDGPKDSMSIIPNKSHSVPIWSNGILPVSPRKGRSTIRDRKLRDRPNPLGPNGKVKEDDDNNVILENGQLMPCDYQRPLQHLQAPSEQPKKDTKGTVRRPIEKPRILGKDKTEIVVVEQATQLNFSTNTILPPLGIPFCPASVGGARKTFPITSTSDTNSYYDSGGLSDTDTVRKRMVQITESQDLGDVPMECANVLNNMLDVYLKRLIRSCVELVGARSFHEPTKELLHNRQTQRSTINGFWPSNHVHMQNNSEPVEAMLDQRPWSSISLLDFKVAMELNPQQLGEDWPLRLEKICMPPCEE